MSRDFYAKLPLFTRFEDLTRTENYCALPDDWLILIADVAGSTAAIEAGRYKDVNVVGASCIMAVLNAAGKLDIPYVFGGDGASLLVPGSLRPAAERALRMDGGPGAVVERVLAMWASIDAPAAVAWRQRHAAG